MFRIIAIGRTFYRRKNCSQICIQIRVGICILCNMGEQLTGINEIALFCDNIVYVLLTKLFVRPVSIIYALVSIFHEKDKVFTDETIKKSS